MNGANTDPFAKTNKTAKISSIVNKGSIHNLRLALMNVYSSMRNEIIDLKLIFHVGEFGAFFPLNPVTAMVDSASYTHGIISTKAHP